MGEKVIQLANSANWESVYSQTYTAQQATTNQHAPIPSIDVGTLFDRHILAIYASSSTAKDTWKFAGFLNQKLSMGFALGNIPDLVATQRRKIWLDQITLLIFPKYTPEYAISFDVPSWFTSVSLTIWQYIGVESDSTENLISDVRDNELARIEAKVEDIATRNN